MESPANEPNTSGYAPSYDAGDSARRAHAYVTEILEHDAELRAREPVSPKRKARGRVALFVTAPIMAALTAFNIAASRGPAVEPRASHEALKEAQVGVYLAMQQVEAYRAANGLKVPPSLGEVGADLPGIEYQADGRSYALTARVDGMEASYRSGDDRRPFELAAAELIDGKGGS